MTDEILNTVPDDADVYEATLAFERALDAAPSDRTLLRRWTARFPEFEDDFITVGYSRFALGLTLADPVADYDPEPEAASAVRPPLTGLLSEAQGLSAAEMARFLRMDRILLLRLEQRFLPEHLLPRSLIARLAQALERSTDEVRAYLRGPSRLATGTHYRSHAAPRLVAERLPEPLSFADEVRRNPKMSDEDKQFWLAEIEKEKDEVE